MGQDTRIVGVWQISYIREFEKYKRYWFSHNSKAKSFALNVKFGTLEINRYKKLKIGDFVRVRGAWQRGDIVVLEEIKRCTRVKAKGGLVSAKNPKQQSLDNPFNAGACRD